MPNPTYFYQECPTCGRQLQIRVEYLGRHVVCQHCRGRLVAMDSTTARFGSVCCGDAMLKRADALLKSLAMREAGAHCPLPQPHAWTAKTSEEGCGPP